MAFKPAQKQLLTLKLLITGPWSSGKSMLAIIIGDAIAKRTSGKLGGIDSENKMALYKHLSPDILIDWEFQDFAPESYTRKLWEAERLFSAVVMDGISPEWEFVVAEAERLGNGQNKFNSWGVMIPRHDAFTGAIMRSPAHVICTAQTKIEWALEPNAKGKLVPRKVGMKPVQRDNIGYVFDFIIEMDEDHNAIITKSRCPALRPGTVIQNPGVELAETLLSWLEDGATPYVEPWEIKALNEHCKAVLESTDNIPIAARKLYKALKSGNVENRPINATPEQLAKSLARLIELIGETPEEDKPDADA